MNRRLQPTGWSADGSTVNQYNKPAQAEQFRNDLISMYDYDPGSLGDIDAATDSDLAFLRFDFNLGTSHQLTLRHNFIDAVRDHVLRRALTFKGFGAEERR